MTDTGESQPAAVGHRHRTDIDGLRAVAVVLVVLYHASVPWFRIGFIGVDVFFVISGYLITGLLVSEARTSGRISLRRFWARRMRRLVPALTAMTLGTLALTVLLVSPLRWGEVSRDAIAAALYASNLRFGLRSVDYFNSFAQPSPLLHTWSLAVEEQFYLLWPLAIVALGFLCRLANRSLSWALRWLTPPACVASLGLSFLLTRRMSPWAYYSLPTRWWEMGTGAALAVWTVGWIPRRATAIALAVLGVGGLVTAMIAIAPTTPFPGVVAVLPVVATLCLLAAGLGPSPLAGVLAIEPLQWLGRMSYSWYLWHWPMIVIAASLRIATGAWSSTAVAIAALVPAAACYRWIERPIRTNTRLASSARSNLALGTACAAVVCILAGVLAFGGTRTIQHDPFLAALQRVEQHRVADLNSEQSSWCRPGVACQTAMLIGDSHAAHWIPAFEVAAKRLGLRLVLRTKGGCPPWSLDVALVGTDRPSSVCRAFHAKVTADVERLRPDIVIVASGNYSGTMMSRGQIVEHDQEGALWRGAVRTYLSWLSARVGRIALVLDNPYVPFDPLGCLGRTERARSCEFHSDEVSTVVRDREGERAAARDAGVTALVDPFPFVCDPRCATWRDGGPIYADHSHLTAAFARRHGDDMVRLLAPLVGSA